MYMTCCVCKRIISAMDDYDRIDRDFYCGYCSGLRLITCPICETYIDPNVDTEFQTLDGVLLCCKECLEVYSVD